MVPCPLRRYVYHRKSDGSMLRYEYSCTAKAIITAALRGQTSLENGSWKEEYVSFDLKRMKQVNLIISKEEEKIVRIPWSPKMLASVMEHDQALRREVLCMELGKLIQEDHLTKIIRRIVDKDARCIEFISFRSNPHVAPERQMYTNFLESLHNAAQLDKPGLENFLDIRRGHEFGSERYSELMVLGFHGTNHIWMENILEVGMDPSLRKHGVDWFSVSPLVSMLFTLAKTSKEHLNPGGNAKLLVFLLIKAEAKHLASGVRTLSSTANELPIGEVTLKLLNGFFTLRVRKFLGENRNLGVTSNNKS